MDCPAIAVPVLESSLFCLIMLPKHKSHVTKERLEHRTQSDRFTLVLWGSVAGRPRGMKVIWYSLGVLKSTSTPQMRDSGNDHMIFCYFVWWIRSTCFQMLRQHFHSWCKHDHRHHILIMCCWFWFIHTLLGILWVCIHNRYSSAVFIWGIFLFFFNSLDVRVMLAL